MRPGATGMPTAPVKELVETGREPSALLRAVTSDWTAAPGHPNQRRTGAAPATAARSRPRECAEDGTGKGWKPA